MKNKKKPQIFRHAMHVHMCVNIVGFAMTICCCGRGNEIDWSNTGELCVGVVCATLLEQRSIACSPPMVVTQFNLPT